MLSKLKRDGLDITQHKPAISASDMNLLYTSGTLSNTNPESLQNKVFVELALHFGRRGREGWRDLKKESFIKNRDPQGREYITIKYNEFDKNHRESEIKNQLMFATGDSRCPVKSFEMYTQKLNPRCSAFLQRPSKVYKNKDIWYDAIPIGIHTINNMLPKICKKAGTSIIYTNHSLKASTATVLKQAGVPSQDIMAVTGHKNVASLASYAAGPSAEDRARMSKILASHGNQEVTKVIPRKNITATMTQDNDIDVVVPFNNVASTSTSTITTTHQQITTQDNLMSSVFAGANFNGPVTINIQYNNN
jgi:hypothetical protein